MNRLARLKNERLNFFIPFTTGFPKQKLNLGQPIVNGIKKFRRSFFIPRKLTLPERNDLMVRIFSVCHKLQGS